MTLISLRTAGLRETRVTERAEDEGRAWDNLGMFEAGQAVRAVGTVCGGSRRGLSWGDVARSSWSGMTRLGISLTSSISK